MNKKLLCGLLAVAMTFGLLCGCGVAPSDGGFQPSPLPDNAVQKLLKTTGRDDPDYFRRLAVLAVEDDGSGVPPAERERIFERFTQLDSGATRLASGVGLGLYIARQLANAQGGELLATDPLPPGRGARFELRLPLAEPSSQRPG